MKSDSHRSNKNKNTIKMTPTLLILQIYQVLLIESQISLIHGLRINRKLLPCVQFFPNTAYKIWDSYAFCDMWEGHFLPRHKIRNCLKFHNKIHNCSKLYEAELMMTSSNGNIFRVTGHLCWEFTGPRWIPRTKASDAELWCFLWSAPE